MSLTEGLKKRLVHSYTKNDIRAVLDDACSSVSDTLLDISKKDPIAASLYTCRYHKEHKNDLRAQLIRTARRYKRCFEKSSSLDDYFLAVINYIAVGIITAHYNDEFYKDLLKSKLFSYLCEIDVEYIDLMSQMYKRMLSQERKDLLNAASYVSSSRGKELISTKLINLIEACYENESVKYIIHSLDIPSYHDLLINLSLRNPLFSVDCATTMEYDCDLIDILSRISRHLGACAEDSFTKLSCILALLKLSDIDSAKHLISTLHLKVEKDERTSLLIVDGLERINREAIRTRDRRLIEITQNRIARYNSNTLRNAKVDRYQINLLDVSLIEKVSSDYSTNNIEQLLYAASKGNLFYSLKEYHVDLCNMFLDYAEGRVSSSMSKATEKVFSRIFSSYIVVFIANASEEQLERFKTLKFSKKNTKYRGQFSGMTRKYLDNTHTSKCFSRIYANLWNNSMNMFDYKGIEFIDPFQPYWLKCTCNEEFMDIIFKEKWRCPACGKAYYSDIYQTLKKSLFSAKS